MKRFHLFALAGVAVVALAGAGCAPSDPSDRSARSARSDRSTPSGGSSPETAAAAPPGGAAITDPASFLPRGSERPPNILLVTVDTLRADHLSAWGYKRATSPNIDRLASAGVRFDQAQTQWPKTGPSFTSIFTSTYPKDNGIVRQIGIPVPCTFTMLAEALQRAGYGTHAVVANGAVGREFYFDQGFDTFLESWKLPPPAGPTSDADPNGAENVTRLALVAAAQMDPAKPWFLWVHYLDPHAPYIPPVAFQGRFQDDAYFDGSVQVPVSNKHKQELAGIGKGQVLNGDKRLAFYVARYDAEISYVDQEIGRLLAALGQQKRLEDTLTAFTSDHGESLGEHGYYFNHGRFGFQTCLHVPLILHWPGRLKPAVDEAPVQLLHLAPTLLAAAGVDLADGRGAQGESLWPRIANPPDPEAAAGILSFSEAGTSTNRSWIRIARNRRFVLQFAPHKLEQNWISGEARPWALFDLETDPGETKNVVDLHPAEVERLQEAIGKWWRAPTFDCTTDDAICDDNRAIDKETTELLKSLGYL